MPRSTNGACAPSAAAGCSELQHLLADRGRLRRDAAGLQGLDRRTRQARGRAPAVVAREQDGQRRVRHADAVERDGRHRTHAVRRVLRQPLRAELPERPAVHRREHQRLRAVERREGARELHEHGRPGGVVVGAGAGRPVVAVGEQHDRVVGLPGHDGDEVDELHGPVGAVGEEAVGLHADAACAGQPARHGLRRRGGRRRARRAVGDEARQRGRVGQRLLAVELRRHREPAARQDRRRAHAHQHQQQGHQRRAEADQVEGAEQRVGAARARAAPRGGARGAAPRPPGRWRRRHEALTVPFR